MFLFCLCFCFTNKHMQALKLKRNRFIGSIVRYNDHDRKNTHKQQQIQTTGGHIFHKHQQIQPIFSIMMSLDRKLHVTLTAYTKNYKTQTNPNKNSLKTQTMTNFLLVLGPLNNPLLVSVYSCSTISISDVDKDFHDSRACEERV